MVGGIRLDGRRVIGVLRWHLNELTQVAHVAGRDTFYEDSSRPYGVNNKVYVNVSMPHVLEDIQSELSEEEYDRYIADITNFLTYVSDPSAETRKQLGIYVILFLLIFTAFAYLVYREFKKDLK